MENHSHYVTTQQYGKGEEVWESTESMLLKREETEGLVDEYPPLEKKSFHIIVFKKKNSRKIQELTDIKDFRKSV